MCHSHTRFGSHRDQKVHNWRAAIRPAGLHCPASRRRWGQVEERRRDGLKSWPTAMKPGQVTRKMANYNGTSAAVATTRSRSVQAGHIRFYDLGRRIGHRSRCSCPCPEVRCAAGMASSSGSDSRSQDPLPLSIDSADRPRFNALLAQQNPAATNS